MFLNFVGFCRKRRGDCFGMLISGLILIRLSVNDEAHVPLMYMGVTLLGVGMIVSTLAMKKGL